MKIKDIGEFGLIERLQEMIQKQAQKQAEDLPLTQAKRRESLQVGIGDDAAVWRPTPGMELVLTCDALLEGKHFPASLGPEHLHQIGRRAATANLSDLAAMAAMPRFALVSLGIPPSHNLESIEQIYQGITEAIYQSGAQIIGGNITSTQGPLFLDLTLGGEVQQGQAIQRIGANVGDWIGVTGYPGHSAAGLAVWQASEAKKLTATQKKEWKSLLDSYFSPTARLEEAKILAPFVTSMTDISDGLLHDLGHLLFSQGFGAKLFAAQLPQHKALAPFANWKGTDIRDFLFGASDDYELLFSIPKQHAQDITNKASEWNLAPIHWIGEVTQSAKTIVISEENGTEKSLETAGWDHFKS